MEAVVWVLLEVRTPGQLVVAPDGTLVEVDGPVAIQVAGAPPRAVDLPATTEVLMLVPQGTLIRWHTRHRRPRKSVTKRRVLAQKS